MIKKMWSYSIVSVMLIGALQGCGGGGSDGDAGPGAPAPEVKADTAAPVVTAFTMPATANQTVNVTSFTATDDQGVTGYMVVCQSAAAPAAGDLRWTPAAPVTVTATGVGQQSFYAWVKDAAGNVSAAFAPVVVTVNPVVNVSGSAFDTLAASSDATFNFAPGNYQYNIPGFGAGDKLVFPAGNPPTVINSSFTDGLVTVNFAKDQQIVTVVLTGLTTTQDGQIVGVSSFNNLFGAGSITQQ